MFAKDLVILGVAGAMPTQTRRCYKKSRASALASTFSHAAIEPANPALNLRRLIFDKRYGTPVIDSLPIAQVRRKSHLLDYLVAEEINDGCLLTVHNQL